MGKHGVGGVREWGGRDGGMGCRNRVGGGSGRDEG